MAGSKQINRLAGFASDASALSSIAASPPRVAPLPQRSVLEISGPDAQKFLKGLSCKDVESTDGGYSGFLNPSVRLPSPPQLPQLIIPRAESYIRSSSSPSPNPDISSHMNLRPPIQHHWRPSSRHSDSAQKSVYGMFRKSGNAGRLGVMRMGRDRAGRGGWGAGELRRVYGGGKVGYRILALEKGRLGVGIYGLGLGGVAWGGSC